MKIRQARKILQKAALKLESGHPYSHSQIVRCFKRIWHSSRFDSGPREGKRMLLQNHTIEVCAKVFSGGIVNESI